MQIKNAFFYKWPSSFQSNLFLNLILLKTIVPLYAILIFSSEIKRKKERKIVLLFIQYNNVYRYKMV